MKLKPWYTVAIPREDLREGKPTDASEFAVHLDKVRDGNAPPDYQNPAQFFAKTYLTKNMLELASQVVKRMNGVQTETSSVFNLATQFGGGKTHSLTLLYHLCVSGPESSDWVGVSQILRAAEQSGIPRGSAAVFVGTEFDSLSGRSGETGEPNRKTPWGEIAWQLGGPDAFALVARHDEEGVSPGGDVLNKLIPDDQPCLILMDELMNYISRNRKNGLADQFYNFLQNLTETVRGKKRCVLAVSIPASEMEMNAQDVQDYNRITKLLDRLGKAMVMSAEAETSEIIRRRLFEWDPQMVGGNGKVLLDKEATRTCREYAQWCVDHRQQIPGWFSVDEAQRQFQESYPFHPSVLSVFERKWRGIPKFQQTRGILRLLALWVSQAYKQGYSGAHRDALITLGTAPLDNSTFRSACFEQLGERNLETAITTDIAGGTNAHSIRLDQEATEEIKKTRLHQKVATTIFFESNGGQLKGRNATLPEIRLSVGDPDVDIGNVETTLEGLADASYYLTIERNEYRYSLRENLNKRFADRRATIQNGAINDRVRREIQAVFGKSQNGVLTFFFPESSGQIPDQAVLQVVVADFTLSAEDSDRKQTEEFIQNIILKNGTKHRTFKSAQIWMVSESPRLLREEAARLLAWEEIEADSDLLNYDEFQIKQLRDNIKRAKMDLKECVWRSYKHVFLLAKEGDLKHVDMGLMTSSQTSGGPVDGMLGRLIAEGEVEKEIGPRFLTRNWSSVHEEWSTKSVRDAFFSAPNFPRLLKPESLRETIARGVAQGLFAYVGKRGDGLFDPFHFEQALHAMDVEISDELYLIPKEAANAFRSRIQIEAEGIQKPAQDAGIDPVRQEPYPAHTDLGETPKSSVMDRPQETVQTDFFRSLSWSGDVEPHKWMNFYTKILSKYAQDKSLKLKIQFRAEPQNGITPEKIEETKSALRDLGLSIDQLEQE